MRSQRTKKPLDWGFFSPHVIKLTKTPLVEFSVALFFLTFKFLEILLSQAVVSA